jgi:hypothetical protein
MKITLTILFLTFVTLIHGQDAGFAASDMQQRVSCPLTNCSMLFDHLFHLILSAGGSKVRCPHASSCRGAPIPHVPLISSKCDRPAAIPAAVRSIHDSGSSIRPTRESDPIADHQQVAIAACISIHAESDDVQHATSDPHDAAHQRDPIRDRCLHSG